VTGRRLSTQHARTAIIAVLVAVVAYLLWSKVAATYDANQAGAQAQAVAGPVDQMCSQGDAVAAELARRGACQKAAEALQSPVVPPPATVTVKGEPGRGIERTDITNGHLFLRYSDGTTEDKGPVMGQPGTAGTEGKPGRSIVGSTIAAGRLVLSYSDKTTEDVGAIIGPKGDTGKPGRGISSSAIVDGRLVLTYDDGTTQDLGPLPVGRGVKKTEVVSCRWRVTYTDGVTEDAGNACTTQTETQTQTVTPTPTSSAPSTTDSKTLLPVPPS
jgi:hypothetical protein